MAGVVVTAGASGAAVALSRDDAARVLFNLHYAPLAGWCAVLLGDAEAARDVASEAFTRLLARWVTVKDPKGYLYVTATNLVKDKWRREQRDRKLCAHLEQTVATSTPAPDLTVRDMVERLPERTRVPVLLHFWADMSVADVARHMHRPEGTVKRLLSDARTQLREMHGVSL
jgi:RNA polymerase sigma-70 factor (ECF subfamily)